MSSRKRKPIAKTKTSDASDKKSQKNSTSTPVKNSPKASPLKGKKKSAKTHGLSTQQQVSKSNRNKLFIAVFLYIAIGAGILLWKGMSRLPEIPPELESEILGSYPQQLKDIDMPKNMKKKSTVESDNNKFKGFSFAPIKKESGKVVREWKEIKLNTEKPESSVRTFAVDNFLSDLECDELKSAHEARLKALEKYDPIFCFADESAMQAHLALSKVDWAGKVSAGDFLTDTRCLNQSLSSELKNHVSWSHSTSIYGDESKLPSRLDSLIQRHIGLAKENAEKIQVISYGEGVTHKYGKDNSDNLPEPAATILIYLEGVEGGGETDFVELGLTIKPHKGSAIVWNNFDVEGRYDATSQHKSAPVTKGKKYILQRRYFVGKVSSSNSRPDPPSTPIGSHKLTPRVYCDQLDGGNCRWLDEWS